MRLAHPSNTDSLRVEFWGGPADGDVLWYEVDDLPINLCRHPRHPDVEYVIFKHLGTGKLTARFVRPQR